MTFLATTRVAILRGTVEDALGDEVDDNGTLDEAIVDGLSDIPASLIETSKAVYDPASGTRRTVRVIACELPTAVGHPDTGERTPVALWDGDRIKDNVTGRIYAIDESVHIPRSLAGMSSLTLDLRDTAAVASTPA